MAARNIRHEQDKHGRNANFTFVLVGDGKELSPAELHNIVGLEIESFGTPSEFQSRFDEIEVIVETARPRAPIDLSERLYGRRGRVHFYLLRRVTARLQTKREEEARARKTPGHVSYAPETRLTARTFFIFVGSRPFLARLMRVYMEEIHSLRRPLLDAIELVCGLTPFGRNRVGDNTISIRPDAKEYLTYNLNWLRERYGHRTTDELLEDVEEARDIR
jgi:hypothetical protein